MNLADHDSATMSSSGEHDRDTGRRDEEDQERTDSGRGAGGGSGGDYCDLTCGLATSANEYADTSLLCHRHPRPRKGHRQGHDLRTLTIA